MVINLQFESEEETRNMAPMPLDIMGRWNDSPKWLALIISPESILVHRKAVITRLIDIPYDLLKKYTRQDPETSGTKPNVCSAGRNQDQCDAIIYGSVVLGLLSWGLYPRPVCDDCSISIEQVTHQLKTVKIHALPGKYDNHYSCPTDFCEKVDAVLQSPTDPILASHLAHMDAQNKRLRE
jgi:hypothetical protein